jgi:REP element-mobilizing transposase RayT
MITAHPLHTHIFSPIVSLARSRCALLLSFILGVNIGHIHLFIKYPAKYSVSGIAKRIIWRFTLSVLCASQKRNVEQKPKLSL